MDGNGRWARQRGRPRLVGHREGAKAVRRTVEAAVEQGVSVLTLHAFSADNWKRPRDEVNSLMHLFAAHLESETAGCVKNGIRLSVIGRRDRLDGELLEQIEWSEATTAGGTKMHLRLAVDYSSRESLVHAARRLRNSVLISAKALEIAVAQATHADPSTPGVDLLIRTGGEQRLSDLFAWDCAYAELWFTQKLWPDFCSDDLAAAIADFRKRDRRFGTVTDKVA
jgi:undecaprenyl diphosphate synthase